MLQQRLLPSPMTKVNVSSDGRFFTRVIQTFGGTEKRILVAELDGVRVYCVPDTGEIIVTRENLYAFDTRDQIS